MTKSQIKLITDFMEHYTSNWKEYANRQNPHSVNPLPALTHQSVLDLNAACWSKRTKAYWLFSS